MFEAMMESIKEESVGYLFNVQVELDQPAAAAAPTVQPMSVSDMLAGSGLSGDGEPGGAQAPAAAGAAGASVGASAASEAARSAGAPAGEAAAEPEVHVEDHHPLFRAKGLEQPRRTAELQYSAPTAEGSVEHRSVASGGGAATLTSEEMANTPRNAPCPCGSGKKFKMCHGKH
jgi:preprotein translocase subunit SecA